MTTLNGFASFVLAASMVSTLSAETRCPGNVESLPLYRVNGHLFLMDVSINHSGPYKFLLDTGTQFTIVDSSLASELHLANHGEADLIGTGFRVSASTATLDRVEAGSHAVANLDVFVDDIERLHSIGLSVRGIVGENFLAHFDMLIDNAHSMLCLDDTGTIRGNVKGPHVELLEPALSGGYAKWPPSLIVVARISHSRRPVRLKLDSGSNAVVLYDASQYLALGSFQGSSFHGAGGDAVQRKFATLPPEDVKIGSLEMDKVSLLTPTGSDMNPQAGEMDGLMATSRFRRIFVAHADHFAVLDPW
jgi:hypothetical protein